MKDIWKNSARLLSANVVAQAIGLLVYPILTRLYSPDDFGLFNLFLSIGNVFVIISTAQYHNAIVLPKEDSEAKDLFQIGLLYLGGVVLLVTFSILFSFVLADWFQSPTLARWYWLMPIYVLAVGIWNLVHNWLIRRKDFRHISQYLLLQSVFSAFMKIGLGFVGCLSVGLILSSLIGVIGALVVLFIVLGGACLTFLHRWDMRSLREQAHAYRNFPLFALPRSLVNTLICSAPIFLLSSFCNMETVGYVGFALTLSFLPINTIAGSVGEVFYKECAQRVTIHQPLQPLVREVLLKLVFLIVPMIIVCLPPITAPLVNLLFGSHWLSSATYIEILLPYLITTLLSGVLSGVPDIFGKQKISLWIECVYLIGVVAALCLSKFFSSTIAFATYSAVGTIVMVIQLIWYLRMIKKHDCSL